MPRPKKKIVHDPIVACFGQRLREIRLSRGMTQAQLAEEAQITLSYVTRLESGSSAAGIDLVARLAAALGTAIAELLPTPVPPQDLDVLRQRARTSFDSLLTTNNRQTHSLLNQFIARLVETAR